MNSKYRAGLATLAILGSVTLAACSSSSGSSGASAAQSNFSAVATSPAVQHAVAVAKVEVVNPCKVLLPLHWKKFLSCTYSKLGISGHSDAAEARRGALTACLYEAGNADNVLHPGNKAGRLHFEQVTAPDCVAQILLANKNSSSSVNANPDNQGSASPSPKGSQSS